LLELREMARPFGRFGQTDVFFALPAHRMKEHHAERRHDAAMARSEGPQRGRRALAGDDAGRLEVSHFDQRHQRYGTIRAAAGRVEINRALAALLDAEQSIREVGFTISEIADDRDFNRSLFVLAVGHYKLILVVGDD